MSSKCSHLETPNLEALKRMAFLFLVVVVFHQMEIEDAPSILSYETAHQCLQLFLWQMKMMVEWMRYPVLLLALLPVLWLYVLVDFLYNLLHSTCQEIWSEHRATRPFSASTVEPFAFIWNFGIAYHHFATTVDVEEFCAVTLEPTTFI